MLRAAFIAILFLLWGQGAVVWAAPATFTVSATIPAATGISITVSKIDAASNAFTVLPNGTTSLTFDPMTFNSANRIYLPDHYYALDFGVIGGIGFPDVTVTYHEASNPNGTTNGLGYKATATFAREVPLSNGSTQETILNDQNPKLRLIDIVSLHVPIVNVAIGFLRIYLGVWTGNTTFPADPVNGQPFSNADAAGLYTGSFIVTAVVS